MRVHTIGRLTAILIVLSCAPVRPAPAQQAAASATPAPSTLPGPRLGPEWARVEPRFDGATGLPGAAPTRATHTIRVTTLVLVLCVVILVLLIA